MIEVSRTPRALRVTLRDPSRRNALANDDYEALAGALNRIEDERCVVLQGEGNTFCAGNRLDRFSTEWPQPYHGPVHRFLSALAQTPVPVIAVVRGGAVGIGATMLLHCDVVLCEETAFFSYPFVSLGIAPEGGSSMLLTQRIGWCRAAEILLSGRRVPPAELQIDQINRLVIHSESLRKGSAEN
jgi:enoyl-CoA hydratase/carnithine racemase